MQPEIPFRLEVVMDDNATIAKAKRDRGTTDKVKGHVKEAVGEARERVGSAIGDPEMETKGEVQRASGHKDRIKGEVKESVAHAQDKAREGVEKVKAGAEVVADRVKQKLDD
jgi:uncharacterized protein YjbJ (UPF0337 family)